MGAQEREDDAAPPLVGKKQQKSSKEVFFSVLPDRYEPLIEEVDEREEALEERRKRKEEKKWKRKQQYKKYRKNLGRALRFTCRCLLLGSQSVASVYTSPTTAVSTVITEVYGSNRKA